MQTPYVLRQSTSWALTCLLFALAETARGEDVRTIEGAYTITYWQDDGTQTTFGAPQPADTLISALILNEKGEYEKFLGEIFADGTFRIPDVPLGLYFLDVSAPTRVILHQYTDNFREFNQLIAGRADLRYATLETSVTLSISNLDPWTPGGFFSGDGFEIYGSQAGFKFRPFQYGHAVPPERAATSYLGDVYWGDGEDLPDLGTGLPDASLGDVVYAHQYPIRQVGTQPYDAIYKSATKYAQLSDVTLFDGVPAKMDVVLTEAPQTGLVHADIRFSEYESLLASVHPVAHRDTFTLHIYGHPYAVKYPNRPRHGSPILFVLAKDLSRSPSLSDIDYGPLSYGQFLDTLWKEQTRIFYTVLVTFRAPGALTDSSYATVIASFLSGSPIAPIAPALGPPTAPQINGRDAFEAQSGVGLEPVLFFSPPTVGTATSYSIFISEIRNESGQTVFEDRLSAKTYDVVFKVPPGILSPGALYLAEITAVEADWDVIDAPFGEGVASHQASCITSQFTP